MNDTRVTILDGFDDPRITPEVWNGLLRRGSDNCVFLTYAWQRSWWESFGRGQLLLIAAECGGKIIAVAPLFSEAGMVYFVGSGGSDYLGFVGDVGDVRVLMRLLEAARRGVGADFIGFAFYMVPDDSPIGRNLATVAEPLGLESYDQGELPAPVMELSGDRAAAAAAAADKTSLVRHEKYFRRAGALEVRHFTKGGDILPQLDAFFEQHVRRWRDTPYPSLFLDGRQRDFYERVTRLGGAEGWLRFTRVDWNSGPIAFHFGFCYAGSFLWYKPSFEVALARRSPGEVLLRQLILAASEEGATTFDFGIGDEPFKRRFATRVKLVRTWGLYAPEKIGVCSAAKGGA
jgi:CelD/BcsL family acetyltransferase involved in cellulose biosynthesis